MSSDHRSACSPGFTVAIPRPTGGHLLEGSKEDQADPRDACEVGSAPHGLQWPGEAKDEEHVGHTWVGKNMGFFRT